MRPPIQIDHARGIAWEPLRRHDDPPPIDYGLDYWRRYADLDATPLGARLTRLRVELVRRHLPPPARIVDVGIGGGAFLTAALAAGYLVGGHDVNSSAVADLAALACNVDPYQSPRVQALTLWDVIEHLPRPDLLLSAVGPGRWVFCSLPIVPDLHRLYLWKHYRPGEHLWYWTQRGFRDWVNNRGFLIVEESDLETQAGRQDILSFALRRQPSPIPF